MVNEGQVRRVDLYLRAKYLEIETAIYRINDRHYLIYCENIPIPLEEFRNDFNYSIKVLGAPVEVTNILPAIYEALIPPISDKEISKNFEGIPLSKIDLLNLLIGKFPGVYFSNVSDSAGKVIVHTYSFKEKIGDTTHSRFLSTGNRKKILEFFQAMKVPYSVEIVEEEVDSPPLLNQPTIHNPVQYIYANGYKRNGTLDFVERDQTLWYENIDAIFAGEFKKENLYFYKPEEYSCYVDYSSFDNIDIRNHLFLYECVYVTLPFEKDITQWLKSKSIKAEEFLELIRKNRIKIVLTQPESRYDTGFLMEIYRANPNAIISRRAVSALQQIDLVELSDDYIFNDPDIIKILGKLSEATEKVTHVDAKYLYEILVWPIRARRNSFDNIHGATITNIPSFGVNKAVENGLSKVAKKDLSFEFAISSSAIHLANALNATYFPFKSKDGFSDYHFANIMGEMLNLYKNATPSRIKAFEESRIEIQSGVVPINPIEVFNVNTFDSILELENLISKDVVISNNKRLIELLAGLNSEERAKRIIIYNREVEAKLQKGKKGNGIIDLGSNFLLDLAGAFTGFNYLGTFVSAIKAGGKKIVSNSTAMKKLEQKLENSFYTDTDKANIHYLTRINRVARIRGDIY